MSEEFQARQAASDLSTSIVKRSTSRCASFCGGLQHVRRNHEANRNPAGRLQPAEDVFFPFYATTGTILGAYILSTTNTASCCFLQILLVLTLPGPYCTTPQPKTNISTYCVNSSIVSYYNLNNTHIITHTSTINITHIHTHTNNILLIFIQLLSFKPSSRKLRGAQRNRPHSPGQQLAAGPFTQKNCGLFSSPIPAFIQQSYSDSACSSWKKEASNVRPPSIALDSHSTWLVFGCLWDWHYPSCHYCVLVSEA